MKVDKIFRWLLGFSLLGFCAGPVVGVVDVLSVLVLWVITRLVVSFIYSGHKKRSLTSSRSKYSSFYVKDEDEVIPIEGNGDPKTALGNFVMKETWHLPTKVNATTTEIDALLTTEAVVFVFLVEEDSFNSINWEVMRQNIETQVCSNDSTFFAVVNNSGKNLIFRYLSEKSHTLKEIEISNKQLKFLRQR